MIDLNSPIFDVYPAVSHDGLALRYASEEFKENKLVALAAVKQNGSALELISPKLKNDYSFVYDVYCIQSRKSDEDRKKFLAKFFIKETLKLLGALASATIGGLLIASVIALPIPTLAALIFGSVIVGVSGIYATHKVVYQHAYSYFKPSEMSVMSVINNTLARLLTA